MHSQRRIHIGRQQNHMICHTCPYSIKVYFFFLDCMFLDIRVQKLINVHCSQITPGCFLASQTQRLEVLVLPSFHTISHQSVTPQTWDLLLAHLERGKWYQAFFHYSLMQFTTSVADVCSFPWPTYLHWWRGQEHLLSLSVHFFSFSLYFYSMLSSIKSKN